jgi:hypothetical protein
MTRKGRISKVVKTKGRTMEGIRRKGRMKKYGRVQEATGMEI